MTTRKLHKKIKTFRKTQKGGETCNDEFCRLCKNGNIETPIDKCTTTDYLDGLRFNAHKLRKSYGVSRHPRAADGGPADQDYKEQKRNLQAYFDPNRLGGPSISPSCKAAASAAYKTIPTDDTEFKEWSQDNCPKPYKEVWGIKRALFGSKDQQRKEKKAKDEGYNSYQIFPHVNAQGKLLDSDPLGGKKSKKSRKGRKSRKTRKGRKSKK